MEEGGVLRPQACNTKAVAPPKREPIKLRRLRRIPSNEESKEGVDDESDIISLFKFYTILANLTFPKIKSIVIKES